MGLHELLATGGVGVNKAGRPTPDTSDLRDKSESQLVEYATRMRRHRDDLQLVVDQAAEFLERRRSDGIEFPYDSRPLRRLREAAS